MAYTQNITVNTGQQMTVETQGSQTFPWQRETINGSYTNGTGGIVTLAEGTVMGRISATGLLTPFTSGASDGSQFIAGILLETTVVGIGATQAITIVVAGDAVEHKIVLSGADTLETVVSGRRVRDKIMGETKGIRIVPSTEMTY